MDTPAQKRLPRRLRGAASGFFHGGIYVLLAGLMAIAVALAAYLFADAPVLRALPRQMHDVLLKFAAKPPQSDAVAIVDIDEASLQALGQWPWPRVIVAELTRHLQATGARVIVFDILFAEADRTSPAQIRQLWGQVAGKELDLGPAVQALPDFDADFAGALSGGPCVLGCYLRPSDAPAGEEAGAADPAYRGRFFEKGSPDRSFLPQADGAIFSREPFCKAAAGTAFFNTTRDYDQIIRRTPTVWALGPNRLYPSLAIEAVRVYFGLPRFAVFYDEATGGVKKIGLRDVMAPTDINGSAVLNYRSGRFPRVSAIDVIEDRADAAVLKDRIVFVGTSAAGLNDLVATPLAKEFPGVEVHATAADNILAGDLLIEPPWFFLVNLAGIVLIGLLVLLVTGRARAWISLLFVAGVVVAVVGFSYHALVARCWVISPAEMVQSAALTYTFVTVVRFWQEERARRRVRTMFSTMVSDDVLRFMEVHPQSFSLSGERREVTVLFTDLRNFTTLAEGMEPAQLSALMNEYFTPMTDLVLARRGFVNKFNGDSIMAVWGAPLDVPDHALQACLCALEMQAKLAAMRAALQAKYGAELVMRVGVNSGVVTAGNMGSERRFEYTVLGDVVNQASRFESENKHYGTSILIGEPTQVAAGDALETRYVDATLVKGKTHPVRIYELLGRAHGPAPPAAQGPSPSGTPAGT